MLGKSWEAHIQHFILENPRISRLLNEMIQQRFGLIAVFNVARFVQRGLNDIVNERADHLLIDAIVSNLPLGIL